MDHEWSRSWNFLNKLIRVFLLSIFRSEALFGHRKTGNWANTESPLCVYRTVEITLVCDNWHHCSLPVFRQLKNEETVLLIKIVGDRFNCSLSSLFLQQPLSNIGQNLRRPLPRRPALHLQHLQHRNASQREKSRFFAKGLTKVRQILICIQTNQNTSMHFQRYFIKIHRHFSVALFVHTCSRREHFFFRLDSIKIPPFSSCTAHVSKMLLARQMPRIFVLPLYIRSKFFVSLLSLG